MSTACKEHLKKTKPVLAWGLKNRFTNELEVEFTFLEKTRAKKCLIWNRDCSVVRVQITEVVSRER